MPSPKGYAITQSGEVVSARLYETTIVKKDKYFLEFNSGGWRTRHTLKCTNLFLKNSGLDAKVYQRKGEWYIDTGTNVYPYRDGFCMSL